MADASVSPRIRWFVRTFLTLLVVCALARIEAWPLTGWRLFSHVRKPLQTSWSAVVIAPSGAETPLSFADAAFRGTTHVLDGLAALPRERRDAVCAAWTAQVRRRGGDIAAIRVDRVTVDRSRRIGRRAAPPLDRVPRYECRGGRVRSLP